MSEPQLSIAILTVRILAGVLFFFQGYDKVFNVGVQQVKNTMNATLTGKNIPDVMIGFASYFTSWVELICGFLLIIGFFKFFASYLLCMDLMIISIGFSLAKPMWESVHIFTRLALILFILITPPSWDVISFDYLFTISGLSLP